ncbi:signal transducer and activator of transcription 6 isoform X2 [Cynoglossus semilaevis]|uniref:Signal transducer and activator of transcription n=2 Tax=Cynoglossus semilaevis TaxID=244447 RepID=A0A3P8UMV5_CYNSE|nr:signal transducer and activator of transcription 6-like isoform X2 [Cynoglossus semilaevis]
MTQWQHMSHIIQMSLSDEAVNNLYPQNAFPIEVRHFLAEWIENQRWENFALENMEGESQARVLLDQTISQLQSISKENPNVVVRMKLKQISKVMAGFQREPLQFAVLVRDILRRERSLINTPQQMSSPQQYPSQFETRESSFPNTQDVDHLVLKVLEVQDIRQNMHQIQEELNWDRQNFESLQGQIQQNGLDPSQPEIQKLQNHIQQLEYNLNTGSMKRLQLLQECVDCLDQCQVRLINRLKAWQWEQHKATIGHPFDENLHPLQTWCEQLLGVNGKLRQELMLMPKPVPELLEQLGQLLQVLIQGSLVVEKQPPQVIKTQSKFSTTVRYLLGEKVAPGKPVVLKAQIINELQARNLGNVPGDNVGELINNTAILEHNSGTKSTCATFRNMSIKKIKRADRKGSESVTEEKFALLFSAEITITGCDTPYRIQRISLPLVVIVHGSQDNNALATIIWDCAFSEPDRVPFFVPERVPWTMMYNTLNSKFTSEVQTQHNLDKFNQHFLAQKIFDKSDFADDYSNMLVSWSQFNKEVLPGRSFTFWQWFEGVMDLTKKHLKTYWSAGLIFGFIGKQHLHLILQDRPNGTFLLRFSDSEIGGITIAYVSASENGGQKIQNIQPFTKRDLEIRSLGDRIRDISHITHLYPDLPKQEIFKKFYSEPQVAPGGGYIPVSLLTKVGTESGSATPPLPVQTPVANNLHSPLTFPGPQFQPTYSTQNSLTHSMMETAASPDDFRPVANNSMDFEFETILQTLDEYEDNTLQS